MLRGKERMIAQTCEVLIYDHGQPESKILPE